VIDLIYRGADRRWRIVDFKSDAVETEPQLSKLTGEYTNQVVRYCEAVRHLLDEPAEGWLCFLNYEACVRWEKVVL
jgi:ATP-dependent exoDNAse (exonuclease V) beta subunit